MFRKSFCGILATAVTTDVVDAIILFVHSRNGCVKKVHELWNFHNCCYKGALVDAITLFVDAMILLVMQLPSSLAA